MNEKESWKSKISLQDETDEVYCQEECHMGKVLQINSIYFLCYVQEPDLIRWNLSGHFLAALSNLIHNHLLQLLSQGDLVLAATR